MVVERFRKKPVVIEAVRWTGDNEAELVAFAGDKFKTVQLGEDPDPTCSVLDDLHGSWILARTGDWVVRGSHGEFHPITNDALSDLYDAVPEEREAEDLRGAG